MGYNSIVTTSVKALSGTTKEKNSGLVAPPPTCKSRRKVLLLITKASEAVGGTMKLAIVQRSATKVVLRDRDQKT